VVDRPAPLALLDAPCPTDTQPPRPSHHVLYVGFHARVCGEEDGDDRGVPTFSSRVQRGVASLHYGGEDNRVLVLGLKRGHAAEARPL